MHKEVMQSEHILNRRSIDTNSLNHLQHYAHDLIIRGVLLDKNESVTDGSNYI